MLEALTSGFAAGLAGLKQKLGALALERNGRTKAENDRNQHWLEAVREEAYRIARWKGDVTADDIRDFAARLSVKPTHRYTMGAVFRDDRFYKIGTRVSRDKGHHGKAITVWGVTQ
jgi:arginyl-tRNA synthetase